MPHWRASMTRLAALALGIGLTLPSGLGLADDDPWPGLQGDAFNSRPMIADSGLVAARGAVPRRGCRHRPDDHHPQAGGSAGSQGHRGDRPQSGAGRCGVYFGREVRCQPHRDPLPRQFLHQGPCRRRDGRGQAPCRGAVRQSLRRLLGAGRQGSGGGRGQHGPDEAAPVRHARWAPRAAADAAASQSFRLPDGPDHPLLHAGHVRPGN